MMAVASTRTISSFRMLCLFPQKVSNVSKYVIRNASKAAAVTSRIAGLGGKLGKVSATSVQVKISVLPVETNVERLTTHLCGSNLLKEGGEDVQLKPDSEYPDWLWKVNIGPKPHYSQLTPNDLEYWRQLINIDKEQKRRIKARLRF